MAQSTRKRLRPPPSTILHDTIDLTQHEPVVTHNDTNTLNLVDHVSSGHCTTAVLPVELYDGSTDHVHMNMASDPTTPDITQWNTLPAPYQQLYHVFQVVYGIVNVFSNHNKTVKYSMIHAACTKSMATTDNRHHHKLTFDLLRQLITIDCNLIQLRPIDPELYNASVNSDVYENMNNRSELLMNESCELYEIIQGKPNLNRSGQYINMYHKFKLNHKLMNDARLQFMSSLIRYYTTTHHVVIPLCPLPLVQHENQMSNYGRLIDTGTVPAGEHEYKSLYNEYNKSNDVIQVDDQYDIIMNQPQNISNGTIHNSVGYEEQPINSDTLNNAAYSCHTSSTNMDPDLHQLLQSNQSDISEHQITPAEADSLLPSNLLGQFRKLLIHLLTQRWYRGQLTHIHTINAKQAITVPLVPCDAPVVLLTEPYTQPIQSLKLHSRVIDVINQQGIQSVYIHQAEAIHKVIYEQQSIVIATSTSSGKTMGYNIPVLQSLCHSRNTKALYLFPTKALAQDQLRTINKLMSCFDSNIRVNTYDGDTPHNERIRIKNESTILLTNPDMLHLSMLPYHHDFKHIFTNLKYVVVDEMHIYRGAFGSHVSMVFRRLHRICQFYGSTPIFICCSATIANPKQLAQQLTAQPNITVIDKDGSPHSAKHIVLWNCPRAEDNIDRTAHVKHTGNNGMAVDKNKISDKYAYSISLKLHDEHRRKSTHVESAVLTSHLVQYNLKSICFAKVRKVCELVTSLVHGYLYSTPSTKPLIPLVKSYRGGYTIQDRRETERKLFNGELRGVISTNALELGIDVGGLDSTVHIGMPLSVSTLWQQAGRCGRGTADSMSIVVAYDSPFDQYFMSNPDKLFIRPSEHAVIDTTQSILLCKHILCAVYELPLTPDQYTIKLFGTAFKQCSNRLIDMKCIRYHNGKYYCHDQWESNFEHTARNVFNKHERDADIDTIQPQRQVTPHNQFSLRTINNNNYEIRDTTNPQKPVLLDVIDGTRAFFDVYPQSVYLYHGREYVVTSVEHDTRVAIVKQIQGRLNYYTKCIDRTQVTTFDRRTLHDATQDINSTLQLSVPSQTLLQQTELVQSIKAVQADRTNKSSANPTRLYHMNGGTHHGVTAIQPGDIHLRDYDKSKRGLQPPIAYSNGISIKTTSQHNGIKNNNIKRELLPKSESLNDIDVVYSIDTSELGDNFPSTMTFELPQNITLQQLCYYGNATVQTNVYGYRKIEKVSGRVLEIHDVSLPTMQTHTQAFWIQIPIEIKRALYSMNCIVAGRLNGQHHNNTKSEQNQYNIKLEQLDDTMLHVYNENKLFAELNQNATNTIGINDADTMDELLHDDITHEIDRTAIPLSYRAALHAIGHGMIGLLQLYILCDALHEIGTECPSEYESKLVQFNDSHDRILLYEEPQIAGLGIAKQGCIHLPKLIDSSIQRIQQCECNQIQGCGGCVQGSCYQAGVVSDKRAALIVLKALRALPVS